MTEEISQVTRNPLDLDGLPSFPSETETAESTEGGFTPVQPPRNDDRPILNLIVDVLDLIRAFFH